MGQLAALHAYGRLFDSMSLCLSKGLDAQWGRCSLGLNRSSQKHTARAAMGGGMRQAGMLAAAGLHALDHHVARLANDHFHATKLEHVLNQHPDIHHVDAVETNIVIFTLHADHANQVVDAFSEMGIACFAFGPNKVRLVTHLDMTTEDIEEACRRIEHWRLEALSSVLTWLGQSNNLLILIASEQVHACREGSNLAVMTPETCPVARHTSPLCVNQTQVREPDSDEVVTVTLSTNGLG